MKILSICSDEYNYEQAKGIIYWLEGNKESHVLRLPNIRNLFANYFILFIYFIFLRWFCFVKIEKKYNCVIVTGRSVVAQALIIADQLSVPLRSVQKPFGYPWFLFEYQYIPYHDMGKYPAQNQIPTLIAPNTMEYRVNNNRKKKISILIGGSIHNQKYEIDEIIKNIHYYRTNKKYEDYEIEAIVSRRTPDHLKKYIQDEEIYMNDKYGATKEAYYNSEVVVITDDSYCMISEAIQSGIQPIVIKTGNIKGRLIKGIKLLFEKKLISYINEFE
jgi:mitochondrial fission protein ELM1